MNPSWGWIFSWGVIYIGRALDSAFRVSMFKPNREPRPARQAPKPTKTIGIAGKH